MLYYIKRVNKTNRSKTMNEDVVWVSFDTMEKFMLDVFEGLGVVGKDARV